MKENIFLLLKKKKVLLKKICCLNVSEIRTRIYVSVAHCFTIILLRLKPLKWIEHL